MKRIGELFHEVCDFDNLWSAYRLARRGKGARAEVARFDLNLEIELLRLQEELAIGRYRPGRYRYRTIYERKPRLISIAPFRDRVVHHALMRVVEPRLDPTMIHDSYACRKGKGVHRAVDRYQTWAARYPYVLHLDIRSYFASIDHGVLRRQLARKIRDRRVLTLFATIIGSFETEPQRGLPIGNLTSQFLANFYLNGIDHWLKEEKRVKGYLRYVDDLFLFGRDKDELWRLVAEIDGRLAELGLRLHPAKIHLRRTSERVDVLGYLVTRDRRWLRNDNGYRFRRRLRRLARQFGAGAIATSAVQSRIRSWIGHALHGETRGLRRTLFREVTFSRAGDQP